MARRIIIKIDPKKGTTEYAIDGIEGTSCTDIANVLMKGQQVEDEGFTQQYYIPDVIPNELSSDE